MDCSLAEVVVRKAIALLLPCAAYERVAAAFLLARRTQVPSDAGPPPDSDQNSHLFLYRSAVNPTRHENSGLVGGIVITRKGEANPDGTPRGVDREIVTLFQV